jgi:hypothetical protein
VRTSRPELLLILAVLGPATAGAQAGPTPLRQAQACYVRDDLGCVIDVLGPASSTLADDAREGLRLLGFAYARLDRHAEAQRTFATWLQRFPDARLERATTPPQVWQDYASAQLEGVRGKLDTRPQLVEPVVLPPPVTASDLPAFSPPPTSSRDKARDFQFGLAAGASMELGGGARPTPMMAAQLSFELLPGRWWAGLAIGGRGHRLRDDDAGAPLRIRVPVLLRVGRQLAGDPSRGLWLVAGGGVHYGSEPSPVLSAGLRYTPSGRGVAGLCAELRDDLDLSAGSHSVVALVGACLRPPAPPASAAQGEPP